MNRRKFLGAAAAAVPAASGLLFGSQVAVGQAPSPSLSEPATGDTQLVPRFGDARDWWFHKRFGLFVHWGLYAIEGWHEQLEWRGGIPRKEFESRYFPQWNPKHYDPDAWLDMAQSTGMEYICFTTKHHEGFCQWDTRLTDFNVMNTPYGKDALRKLADACHKRNFPLGLYYSVVDWHSPLYPNQGRSHELEPQPGDHPDLARYVEFVRGQVRELCTNYGEIHCFWWDMNVTGLVDPSMNDMIRKLQPRAVINNRGFDKGDFGTPERDYDNTWDNPLSFKQRVEANQSVGMESWGFRKDEDYYSHRHLTASIAKYRARDANYLLNVGPDADGRMPDKPVAMLGRIGGWYGHVREAFDDAIPCSQLTGHRNVLLTRKGESLYVVMHQPLEGEELRLRPLATAPQRAVLLNDGRAVQWRLNIAPMEWRDHKPYLRLHQLPVEEFAGTTMVVRLDFSEGDFANLLKTGESAAGSDPATGVLAR
jgi:alpha-L-fucosidase